MDPSHVSPIRAARLRKRFTQERVAAKLGVTKAAVSGWECGSRRPLPCTALALVKLLPGLKIEQIYPKARPSHADEPVQGRAAA